MIKHRDISFENRINKYADTAIVPFTISAGVLLLMGLLAELFFGFGTGDTLGETTAIASTLTSAGKLFEKVLFPVISTLVAISMSDEIAIPAGTLGGFMCAFGYSFTFPTGSITGVSGILGTILLGLVAGGTVRILRRNFDFERKNMCLLYTLASILTTTLIALTIGNISEIVNRFSSMLLGGLMNRGNPLVYVLLGIFVSLNPGGSMYISAMSFSSAMLHSGTYVPCAAITAGILCPVVSLFISCLILRKSFSTPEKINYLAGLLLSVGGLSTSTVVYYVKHPLKALLSFSIGSGFSSFLIYIFGAQNKNIEGGFLSISNIRDALLLVFAIISGALVSSAVTILLTKLPKAEKHRL